MLGSTAAMLGDWDLPVDLAPADDPGRSASLVPVAPASEPLLVESAEDLARFRALAGRTLARRAPRLGQPLSFFRPSRNSRPSG